MVNFFILIFIDFLVNFEIFVKKWRPEPKNIDGFAIHIASKSETSLIESINSLIRNYLARFNRKTKKYSKSKEMIEYSLYLLFDRKYWNILIKDN